MRYAIVFRDGKNVVVPADEMEPGEQAIAIVEGDRTDISVMDSDIEKTVADVTHKSNPQVDFAGLDRDINDDDDDRFRDPRWEE